MKIKLTLFAATFALLSGTAVQSAFASGAYGTCQTTYGGGYGQTCPTGTITINKTVQNPQTKSFVDNLAPNQANYTPGSTVTFKISVKNGGNQDISKVVVKDLFPDFLTFSRGDGKYDASTKTDTLTTDLRAGQTKVFTVVAKIAGAGSLGNPGVTCLINQAAVTTSDGQSATDNAQFCVQNGQSQALTTKGGLPIFPAPQLMTTPGTGAEALGLLALLPTGALGAAIRRRSK